MIATFKEWIAIIVDRKGRLVLAIIGQTLYQIFNYGIDFVLLPLLIIWLGWLNGGLTYMTLTLFIDLISVVLYNKYKKDILGLELAKELRGWLGQKILRSQKKISELVLWAKILVVLGLSWRLNPFQIVIFMRQTNEYRQMNRDDHFIFWVSYFGGNIYWILLVGGAIELGRIFVT